MITTAVAALIGYITNWLAIKMLFWPREEYRVLGIRVPFTPGVFVRRRDDFGSSIGEMVEERFVTEDVITSVLRGVKIRWDEEKASTGFYPVKFGGAILKGIMVERRIKKTVLSLRESRVVSNAVTEAVSKMKIDEIESLLMAVVKKELSAITWFGALLGGVIGALSVFIK